MPASGPPQPIHNHQSQALSTSHNPTVPISHYPIMIFAIMLVHFVPVDFMVPNHGNNRALTLFIFCSIAQPLPSAIELKMESKTGCLQNNPFFYKGDGAIIQAELISAPGAVQVSVLLSPSMKETNSPGQRSNLPGMRAGNHQH